jgi:hypothetical protein
MSPRLAPVRPRRRGPACAAQLTVAVAIAVALLPGGPAVAQEEESSLASRYGDRGTTHLGISLGLGGGGGGVRYAGGVDYGYFVWDGVAPGAEVQVAGGSKLTTTGLALATLRLVPLRTSVVSLFVVGRAGRVLLSDHEDGWGAGGGAGVIFFSGARIGIQLGYDRLELFPRRFCRDLVDCRIEGFGVGIVAGF